MMMAGQKRCYLVVEGHGRRGKYESRCHTTATKRSQWDPASNNIKALRTTGVMFVTARRWVLKLSRTTPRLQSLCIPLLRPYAPQGCELELPQQWKSGGNDWAEDGSDGGGKEDTTISDRGERIRQVFQYRRGSLNIYAFYSVSILFWIELIAMIHSGILLRNTWRFHTYVLSLKSNGCIIFIAALAPEKLIITSNTP
jgi:hypothetical protein